MSTHVSTNTGIKTITETHIQVSEGVVRRATEGWICTVVNGDGLPIDWKPFMAEENIHPAFKVYTIPRTQAANTGMARTSTGTMSYPYNTKVIPHPVLDDHFISVYIGFSLGASALSLRVINGATGAIISSASMTSVTYSQLYNNVGQYGVQALQNRVFNQDHCAIHPFVYKASGQWHVGICLDVDTRETIPTASNHPGPGVKVNEIIARSPSGHVATSIDANVSTHLEGYVFHGALSYSLDGTDISFNGKILDYFSNKYYLGPIDQVTRPTSKPTTASARTLFIATGAKLFSNTDTTSSISGVVEHRQYTGQTSEDFVDQNMNVVDVDMVTPFPGLSLHAHSKYSVMPGFRGVVHRYGFTGTQYAVRRKHMYWHPGILGGGYWGLISPNPFRASRGFESVDNPSDMMYHREQSAAQTQVVYGTNGKPYLVVAVFTAIDTDKYPQFQVTPTPGTQNPLLQQDTQGNGVITITVYDLEMAHAAMVNPQMGVTGQPWTSIIKAHSALRTDLVAPVFNRAFDGPLGGMRGFKLMVEPNLKRPDDGYERFDIGIYGLVDQPDGSPVQAENIHRVMARCNFLSGGDIEPANMGRIDVAENAIHYRVGVWGPFVWGPSSGSLSEGYDSISMPEYYGMDGRNFAPTDTGQGGRITVPFRNTWDKDLPGSAALVPGSKMGMVSFEMSETGQLAASFTADYFTGPEDNAPTTFTLWFDPAQTANMAGDEAYGISAILNTDFSHISSGESLNRARLNWSAFSQPISDRAAEGIKNTVAFTVFAGDPDNPTPAYIVSVDLNKLTDSVF